MKDFKDQTKKHVLGDKYQIILKSKNIFLLSCLIDVQSLKYTLWQTAYYIQVILQEKVCTIP